MAQIPASPPQKGPSLDDLRYIQQMYQNQFLLLTQEVNTRMESLRQWDNVQRTLENLASLENKKTLIPLGGDAYLDGKVTNAGSIVVGVGAGYMVEKKTDDAKAFAAKAIERETANITRLTKSKKEVENALIEVAYRIDELSHTH